MSKFIHTILKLNISDKISFFSCTFSALLLIATFISVACAFKAYHHQKERAKKEAACKLARVYADSVLSQYQVIVGVFIKSDVLSFIKNIFPMDYLCSFSYEEMITFSVKAKVSEAQLKSKMETFDPLCILDVITENTSSIFERNALNAAYSTFNTTSKKREPKNSQFMQSQFMDTISHLLNTVEWFSMNCRYGLADEELLYQSLHQTFLSMVWMLYYFISKNNLTNEDKYFTNTIWLFRRWKSRLREQTLKTTYEKNAAVKSIKHAKEKYDNAGCNFSGKALK